jgi:glutathione S-transferase
MAKELGLEFAHIPLVMGDATMKQPGFLKINPAGRVPAIDDDGFALSESLAIDLYILADRAYLLGSRFSVADLNVACVVSTSRVALIDMQAFPKVADWGRSCRERPALIAARAMAG